MARTALADALPAYRQGLGTIRDQVLAHVVGAWQQLDGAYYDADMLGFAQQVVPVIEAGQRHVASLTDAYLAMLMRGKDKPQPVGVPTRLVTITATRNGADPLDVYQRPGVTVRWRISQGDAVDVAAGKGLTRVQNMARADLQLAKTHAVRYVLSKRARRG